MDENLEVYTTQEVLQEICNTVGDISVSSFYDTIHKIFPSKSTYRFTKDQVETLKSFYKGM